MRRLSRFADQLIHLLISYDIESVAEGTYMTHKLVWLVGIVGLVVVAMLWARTVRAQEPPKTEQKSDAHNMPDSYWKKKLAPDVYQVTRCSATEAPFTGKYWNCHEPGVYRCSNCGAVLFSSKDKFDSGTGWPSFTKTDGSSVEIRKDYSHGMTRDEVICKHCGAHLGHLFDDGPMPTGQRYCINSAALDLHKDAGQAK